MSKIFHYPVSLDIEGKKVLVVGDGAVADEKIKELKTAKAEIVQIQSDKYQTSDLEEAWLVIAATGDSKLNTKIAADATQRHIWINAADDPENCTAILPARIRRGSLLITVSTNGLSPALSVWLRNRIEHEVGVEYEDLLNIVSEVRKENTSNKLLDWQTTLDLAIGDDFLDLIRKGNLAEAKVILKKCLSS